MPTYNISVVVDPSGAVSGVNVVERQLDRVKTKAAQADTAIQGAFDFSTGAAVSQVAAVDRTLDTCAVAARNVGTAAEQGLSKTAAAASRANGIIVNSQAQMRQSTLSLGQQFNDFSTQVLAGGSVVTAFAQQSGQAAFALQGFNGVLGTVGRFLAGPWGTVAIIATTVLAGFLQRQLETNDALDDGVDKLREDAAENRRAAEAREAFSRTTEGLYEAIRVANEEMVKSTQSTREQERADLASAQARLAQVLSIRQQIAAELELRAARGAEVSYGARGDTANNLAYQRDLEDIRTRQAENDAAIVTAQQGVRLSNIPIAQRAAEELSTSTGRINREYDILRDRAIAAARGNDQLNQSLQGTLVTLERQRQAALQADQDQRSRERREASGTTPGVPTFTSRAQAVGIAGRELQGQNLRVSENAQFGGITPGAHRSGHQNAIDVNSGTGIVEANVPDLRARFDQLARSYQARGYRVLWNGQVYEANGSGPTRPIPAGQDQHNDHMHIEAPSTIVGRPTQASTAAQESRQASAEEQQTDFISGIVTQQAQRGNQGVAATAAAQIERVNADFMRRFNREMTAAEQLVVEGAINEAVARETSAYFNEAYVQPLERLRALQDTTGLSRQVLNAQLAETLRLGRELTPIEREQIENGIRQGDALERQNGILESIRGPQEEYAARIAALNALLAQGKINQTDYNAEVAGLGSAARSALGDLPGADPLTGQTYDSIAQQTAEQARYAQELQTYQQQRAQLLALGISYDALVEQARRRHVQNMNAIDRGRHEAALASAQQTAESLLSIAEMSVGQQSAVYKTLFVISKAFAIADSIIKIQQGIANALSLPYPANIAAAASVAAAAASIVSNIQSISLNLADGGYVSGPGTSRSDSIPANLSNGEYVVNAQATRRNRSLLDAINSGRASPVTPDVVSGGGETFMINVGDIIVQGGGGDGPAVGREVKQALVGIVREELGKQSRSGGALRKVGGTVMAN